MVVPRIPKQVPRMDPRMDQFLFFSLPVVDGGAENTQAGAEDGPVLKSSPYLLLMVVPRIPKQVPRIEPRMDQYLVFSACARSFS